MRVWKLVGLSGGQWRRASTLWLLLLCLTFAFELASETIKALFLDEIGSKALPPAFALEAALRLGATALYFLLIRKTSYHSVMGATTLIYVAILVTLMLMLKSGMTGGLTAFYALERVAFKLIMLHWGVYVIDYFTVGESATAFPFIYSAQPLGSVGAGVLLAVNPLDDLSYLFIIAIAAALISLVCLRRATKVLADSPRIQVKAPGKDPAEKWRAAWTYAWKAPVVRYMALATVGLVFVRALLQISAAHVMETTFVSARDIGHFLGYYKIGSNVLVFALQSLLSARLMKALAPTRVNFSYALLTVAGFAGLFLCPGTSTLVFAEMVRKELKTILKTPFSVMMYGTMADYARAPARIAVFGIAVPLAGIVVGLSLMALNLVNLKLSDLLIPGMAVGLVFVVVTGFQNRAYKLALIDLLREKLGYEPTGGSSISHLPDGRILDIRAARQRADYLLSRHALGKRLFPAFYEDSGNPATVAQSVLVERLEELLLLVELYRPHGAPHLRKLVVAALEDRRTDVLDNATQVMSCLLPPPEAASARRLLTAGLARGLTLE